jgi:hypothetical protein
MLFSFMGLSVRKLELRSRLERTFGNLSNNFFSEKKAALVEQALIELSASEAVRAEVPGIERHMRGYLSAKEGGSVLERECALIELYTRLHAAGSRYSPKEQAILERRRGISCHPGGLAPLVMAALFLGPGSVVADLGAGNGLQGLLLQRISPHLRTMQVELSAEMIRVGRVFQQALGIGEDRVQWVHGDIADVSLEAADFIYLYRPARPHEGGNELYRKIALKLASLGKPLVILSVADCLFRFLDEDFSMLYENEHLACLIKRARP